MVIGAEDCCNEAGDSHSLFPGTPRFFKKENDKKISEKSRGCRQEGWRGYV